jgi:hypothetical protein
LSIINLLSFGLKLDDVKNQSVGVIVCGVMILVFVCNNNNTIATHDGYELLCLVLWKKNLKEKINSKRSFNKFQAFFGSEITLLLLLLLLMFLLDTLVNGKFGSLEEEQKK